MQAQTTLAEWARRQAPGLAVVSASVPEPVLLQHNLVAVSEDSASTRDLVRAWERIEPADGSVGMVVLGRSPKSTAADAEAGLETPGADPEGVASHAASRAVAGGVPGALVGALLVVVIVLATGGGAGAVVGGALGGAAFGFVAGAVIGFTARSGWGEAYTHSFVPDEATSVVFASIHSDGAEPIERAMAAADPATAGVQLYRVDADGHARPLP